MSVRGMYEKYGVEQFYLNHKYSNPHISKVEDALNWVLNCGAKQRKLGRILDLGCGNGEVSLYLKTQGFKQLTGCDPFLSQEYPDRLGKCYDFSFEDIALNGLPKLFDTIICSYSLHLCKKSYFPQLLYQLSVHCRQLIVISPTKNPVIETDYFKLVKNTVLNRTHCRIFKSNNYGKYPR